MRVFRISYRIPPEPGGKEQHVYGLTAQQLRDGSSVVVVYARGSDLPPDTFGVPLRTRLHGKRMAHVLFALGAASQIWKGRHGIDVVHLHGDFVEALPVGLASRWCRLPLVCTVHGGVSRRYPRLSRLAFRFVDRFIALGDSVAADLVYLGVPEERIRASHSGLDVARLHVAEKSESRVPGRVVTIGSLDPVKGHDVLIQAVKLLRAEGLLVDLVVIGEGDDRNYLSELAADDAAIVMRGHLGRSEVIAELSCATAFALASRPLPRKREGVPTAALEAMALGLPVLISDTVSLASAVPDRRAYVQVPTDDVMAWSAALASILTNADKRAELGGRALEAAKTFDWRSVAAVVMQQYRAAGAKPTRQRIKVLELTRTLDVGGVETLLAARIAHADTSAFDYSIVTVQARSAMVAGSLRSSGVPVSVLSRRFGLWGMIRLFPLLLRADVDVIGVHSPLPASCVRLVRRIRKAPPRQVTTVHSTDFHPAVSAVDRWRRRHDDVAVAVSGAVADAATCRGYAHVAIRRAGVDVAAMREARGRAEETRRRLGIETGTLICQVASLRPAKDHRTALLAYALVASEKHDAQILLVGDGQERRGLEAFASELGLSDRVSFLGVREDARAIIAASHVLVLSSQHEGLPVVVMEALAAGTPIVATDVGGISELVRPGIDGLLVRAGDPSALADAILTVVSGEFGPWPAGRDLGELDIRTCTRWYENVYRHVVTARGIAG